ncbi:MAG: hypothetical protein QNI99_06650 [Woeseiaceae bacterium]|nr:hypothetical protein [Woeseiaceae bacterium]
MQSTPGRPGVLRRTCILLAMMLCAANAANAESTLQAHAYSEPVQRGASLTDGESAVGFSYDYNFDNGLFAGLSGYYADGTPTGASLTRNLRGTFGWFGELEDERAVEVSVSWSEFPDIRDWDYAEFRVDYLIEEDASWSVAWSPDFFGRDAANTVIGGSWRPAMGSNAYLIVSGGGGYLAGPFDEPYYWSELGLGFAAGRLDVKATLNLMGSEAADALVRPDSTVAVQINLLIL